VKKNRKVWNLAPEAARSLSTRGIEKERDSGNHKEGAPNIIPRGLEGTRVKGGLGGERPGGKLCVVTGEVGFRK